MWRACDGEAGDRAAGERARAVGQQLDALQQVVGDHRQHDVELEVARTVRRWRSWRRCRCTCAATMATASGTTGLTLPGMMLLPGCSAGSAISPRPASGPLFIQRRSLAIFISAHGERPQLAGQLDRRVLGGERCKEIAARAQIERRSAATAARRRGRRNRRMRIDAACRPPCRPARARAAADGRTSGGRRRPRSACARRPSPGRT